MGLVMGDIFAHVHKQSPNQLFQVMHCIYGKFVRGPMVGSKKGGRAYRQTDRHTPRDAVHSFI